MEDKHHNYSARIAKEYNIITAVLLKHFHFWYDKVVKQDHQFFDGQYWVRMKVTKLQKYFYYLSERQLRYTLNQMESKGLLRTGEFNNKISDRTKWYTLTEKSKELLGFYTMNENREITSPTSIEIENSTYKQKVKPNQYGKAFLFLQNSNPVELESWETQSRKEIDDFDDFIEFYEISVEQKEFQFSYHALFGYLKKLKYYRIKEQKEKERVVDHEVQLMKMRPKIG